MKIYTIGHSTRPQEEFIAMLKQFGVMLLADVRTIPRSRFNPQFNSDELSKALSREGIRYLHLKELGGLRKPRKDSPNIGWKHSGFRGYADYMLTPEFQEAIAKFLQIAEKQPTTVMCAEAVYFRCHRMVLSDAMLVRGVDVEHILSKTKAEPHKLTKFARVEGTSITYPPENSLDFS